MKIIQAYIGEEFVWFKEMEKEKKDKLKAGKLNHHDFFKWLEDKNKLYEELTVLIVKKRLTKGALVP